jgi:3-oxoacyl-[acyl-carrier-protein] synthase II
MKRRVVITGRGVILPNANSVDSMMQNLYNGISSIENEASRFDWLKGYRSQLGSLFNGFVFENNKMGIDDKSVKRLGPSVMYSLEAAYQAIKDSGFLDFVDRDRAGCIIGHGLCGILELEAQKEIIMNKGISRVDPNLCLRALPDSSPGFVSITWGLNGECASVATACASGKTAMRYGANAIKNNEADVMVCGGTVEVASPLIFSCFGQIRAMSERNDDPKRASRPFDRDRDGFVLGEGAGIVILEELEHAKKRGATIYGELLGYCGNSDSFHVTAPRKDSEKITLAM